MCEHMGRCCALHHVCMCVRALTLLDIMMVSRDLLCELKATLRVDAWIMMRMAWQTEESCSGKPLIQK